MFGLFEGKSIVKSISDVAMEWIDTDKESAEAKAVMVKALDPNGNMRKQISKDVTQMYKVYLYITLFLLVVAFFSSIFNIGDKSQTLELIKEIGSLFLPITGLFGAIVTASFGVNAMNTHKGK